MVSTRQTVPVSATVCNCMQRCLECNGAGRLHAGDRAACIYAVLALYNKRAVCLCVLSFYHSDAVSSYLSDRVNGFGGLLLLCLMRRIHVICMVQFALVAAVSQQQQQHVQAQHTLLSYGE